MGNHDASSATGMNNAFLFQQERDQASSYWNDPSHDPGIEFIDRSDFPFFYTFQSNDIFFMVWDGSSSRIPEGKTGLGGKPPSLARRLNEPGPEFC